MHLPWTDENRHDPGNTLVQLFAYLGEALTFRQGRASARRRTLLFVLATAALLAAWRRRRD